MPLVTVTFEKTKTTLLLEKESALLELETDPKNELPFGCCNAICGTCALEVISGMENISPKNDAENALLDDLAINTNNTRLGCQCVISGDVCISPLNQ